MFLNLSGREAQGIVAPGAEAAALKAEIIAKLNGLRDGERSESAIREAFDTATLYAGPYLENAPDLLIGYNAGYRVSWDCATGVVAGPVFEDNTKAVERRPLHRSAAGAGRVLLQPRDRQRRAGARSTSRRRRCACSASSRRPTWTAGRSPGWHEADRAGSRSWPLRRVAARASRAAGGHQARSAGASSCSASTASTIGLTRELMAQRTPAELRDARRARQLRRARHVDSAAEPGGLVVVHHRPRSRPPRHLRLHPPRSEDDAAVPVDDADGAARRERLKFGKWQLPLTSGRVELLREGQPFWDVLEQHGIETTIVRMPANFPPSARRRAS